MTLPTTATFLLSIYVATCSIPKQQDDPFFEVRFDMEPADFKRFRERLVRRKWSRAAIRPITARVNLLALVERKMDRLNTLSDQRLAFDDAMNAALKTDIMGFDDSVEGERLRRHIAASDRALHRAIATIIKMRKDLRNPGIRPDRNRDWGAGQRRAGRRDIENTESKVEAQPEVSQTPEPKRRPARG